MAVRLSAIAVAALVKAGRPGAKGDGDNLFIRVSAPGLGKWTFRYMIEGKAREAGLGAYDPSGKTGLSLAEAREAAGAARRLLKAGIDPLAHRRQEAARQAAAEADRKKIEVQMRYTFRACAEEMIEANEASWSNAKHRQQWRSTLTTYAHPIIGDMPVAAVETDDVRRVLAPIWRVKPETATRVKMRVLAVLRHARASGHRSAGTSPADMAEALGILLPMSEAIRTAAGYGHHAALPWAQIGAFFVDLRRRQAIAARALEFLILTAARTGEALGARWREIDLDGQVWTIPAARMKARRAHRVPLSAAAVSVLEAMQEFSGGPSSPVFPGEGEDAPLSQMALLMLLRRMNSAEEGGESDAQPRWRDGTTGDAITAHGFRSTFRDWANEATATQHSVMEAALAHKVGDKVEAAYARGDLFAKRRALMEAWAEYCDRPPADVHDLSAARLASMRTG